MSDIDAVLAFWIEPVPTNEEEVAERGKLWFGGGPDVDAKIRERFGDLLEQAKRGDLDAWAALGLAHTTAHLVGLKRGVLEVTVA